MFKIGEYDNRSVDKKLLLRRSGEGRAPCAEIQNRGLASIGRQQYPPHRRFNHLGGAHRNERESGETLLCARRCPVVKKAV